jgi:hypothetical protein
MQQVKAVERQPLKVSRFGVDCFRRKIREKVVKRLRRRKRRSLRVNLLTQTNLVILRRKRASKV